MYTRLSPLQNDAGLYQSFDQNEGNYFLLLNLNQQIININDAFAYLFGIDIHYVTSKPAKSILKCLPANHAEWFRKMFEIARTGKSAQHEVLINDEIEYEKWIRFDFSPFYNLKNELRGITCIGTNISKEKVQEKKIMIQKKLLNEIASTYSHQLRHPLTNILAIINIMKYDDVSTNKIYFKYLEIASKQLDAVIHQVVRRTHKAA